MTLEEYVFDPDGDLVLILTKQRELLQEPATPQAVLGIVAVPDGIVEQPSEYGVMYTEPSFDEDITLEMVASPSFSQPSNEPLNLWYPEREDHDTTFSTESKDIHMQVSSKHLTLASSVFARMLYGEFREAETLRSAGQAEFRLPDDDPVALSILLNIVHGHNRRVPRRLELTMLTEVASLVDKYYMVEVIEVYSDMWVDNLKDDVPRSFTNDLLPWLCISWVFQKAKIFKNTTKIAQCESKRVVGEARTSVLPIPNPIIDAIENSRQFAISGIISSLGDLRRTYEDKKKQCIRGDNLGFHCDAMVLGSLHKESLRLGLLPTPNPPYQGFSYDSLGQEVKAMNVKSLCEVDSTGYGSYHYGQPSMICSVGKTIEASVESLKDQLGGLDLADFRARSKKSRSKKNKGLRA